MYYLVKDSRHAGSVLGLLVYYLVKYSKRAGSDLGLLFTNSEGFKACWKGLLVCYLREVFKECWKCFSSTGLLPQ